MIILYRNELRRLRDRLRPRHLGVSRAADATMIVQADPEHGRRLRVHTPGFVVEVGLAGRYLQTEAIAVPLDILATCAGRTPDPVVVERITPTQSLVRWDEAGVPQRRSFDVPAVTDGAAAPPLPERFEAAPLDGLAAFEAAREVAGEDSGRFALHSLLLSGRSARLVATDGRQLFVREQLRWPWPDDLLIHVPPPLIQPRFGDAEPLQLGRTERHVVLRRGAWTAWLLIRPDARFPQFETVLDRTGAGSTRLELDPADQAVLQQTLARLPGAEQPSAPVTLDLNGSVLIRAGDGSQERLTELLLDRTSSQGAPLRLAFDRQYLARALALGLRSFRFGQAEDPVLSCGASIQFAWQPLGASAVLAPGPAADRLRSRDLGLEPSAIGHSGDPSAQPRSVSNPSKSSPRSPMSAPNAEPSRNGSHPEPPTVMAEREPASLADLIAEAEALYQTLGAARTRMARLRSALRRHRSRTRQLETTLASLRQIRLPEPEPVSR